MYKWNFRSFKGLQAVVIFLKYIISRTFSPNFIITVGLFFLYRRGRLLFLLQHTYNFRLTGNHILLVTTSKWSHTFSSGVMSGLWRVVLILYDSWKEIRFRDSALCVLGRYCVKTQNHLSTQFLCIAWKISFKSSNIGFFDHCSIIYYWFDDSCNI